MKVEDERGDPVGVDVADPPAAEPRVDVPVERGAVELPGAGAQVVLRGEPLLPHLGERAVGADDEVAAAEPRLHLGPGEPASRRPPGTRCQRTRPLESVYWIS